MRAWRRSQLYDATGIPATKVCLAKQGNVVPSRQYGRGADEGDDFVDEASVSAG